MGSSSCVSLSVEEVMTLRASAAYGEVVAIADGAFGLTNDEANDNDD